MTDLAIEPIRSGSPPTTTDQVFDTLYAAVVSLRLSPGSKVSEAEIAKQLDVSRQPVRDAFFRLSNLGFLSIRPQRATLITKISAQAVFDAAFVRTAIEVECTRLAVERRSPADVARLRAHLDDQTKAIETSDPRAFHGLDEDFHLTLCRIAGHEHAWHLVLDHKAHMDRVRFLTLSADRQREVLQEHTALVDAIEAGDSDHSETLLRAHLGTIRTDLPKVQAAYPDYFQDDAL
ncbi:GntR family transcriptional regulator [Histidinibacterium aquaticum]|uniref:GntR family transcriptional regulator n=1 Tax=Histidinibacterium aquaticum TaxID=2613962 RepID=A0A5J5GMK2_9RHOB|nr:GntR family transcriptional regulator [Histidinibacterium aquaticum]KAA9009405.1 GntR family transcriptional regulator [Histidinibacterium aquaticum]